MAGGAIAGGGAGSFLGTMITESLNNIDKPDENKTTFMQIMVNAGKAGVVAAAFGCFTGLMNKGFNMATEPDSVYAEIYGKPISEIFEGMATTFFGVVDDVVAYIFVDVL